LGYRCLPPLGSAAGPRASLAVLVSEPTHRRTMWLEAGGAQSGPLFRPMGGGPCACERATEDPRGAGLTPPSPPLPPPPSPSPVCASGAHRAFDWWGRDTAVPRVLASKAK